LIIDDSAPPQVGLTELALDARTHLISMHTDAPRARREMRSMAAAAVAAGRIVVIVDMTDAGRVGSSLAWELSRAHERLLWRGGELIAVYESSELESLFGAFALHRAPDVVPTLHDALAAAGVDQLAPATSHGSPWAIAVGVEAGSAVPAALPGSGGQAEVPRMGTPAPPPSFASSRSEPLTSRVGLPASWTFRLRGGPTAPGIARQAVGRVLQGRLSPEARDQALLLVSEAVTNSVRHGGADDGASVELAVTVEREVVRLEITDPLGGFEAPPYPDDPSGHGLPLIHSMSRAWGVGGPPHGNVWFELARGAA
jgi:hypothetical protein